MKTLIDLEKKINSELASKINTTLIKHNQIYIEIDKEDLIDVTLFVKTNKDMKFRQLIDITVVDYPEQAQRFKVVYLFLSHEFNQRMILSYFITENEVISSLGSPNMVTSSGSKNETWIYDRVSTDIQRENESGSAGLEVGFGGSGDVVGGTIGAGASSRSSGEVVVRTQRTLTVIIKFVDGIVSSYQTRSTSF